MEWGAERTRENIKVRVFKQFYYTNVYFLYAWISTERERESELATDVLKHMIWTHVLFIMTAF